MLYTEVRSGLVSGNVSSPLRVYRLPSFSTLRKVVIRGSYDRLLHLNSPSRRVNRPSTRPNRFLCSGCCNLASWWCSFWFRISLAGMLSIPTQSVVLKGPVTRLYTKQCYICSSVRLPSLQCNIVKYLRSSKVLCVGLQPHRHGRL